MTQVLPYNASHRAHVKAVCYKMTTLIYLTIIPLARMGSESIALEAEWAIDSEAMRARGIIV